VNGHAHVRTFTAQGSGYVQRDLEQSFLVAKITRDKALHMSSRKRRAVASPQAPMQTTYQQEATMPADQYMDWNNPSLSTDMNAFNDPTLYEYASTAMPGHNRVVSLETLNDGTEMNSGQLVRRNQNQQLASRRGQWDGFGSPTQQAWEAVDDDEELEQKAAIAKKDAQAKRKQIPPFVQKLSRQVCPSRT